MRIHSTLARLGGPYLMLVMDTFADGRHFVTAIVESPDGGQSVSELGQQVLDAAALYHQAQQHQAVGVHRVQVLAATVARQKVLHVLQAAVVEEHSLVIFFGATDSVCAALMRALGLRRSAGTGAFPVH